MSYGFKFINNANVVTVDEDTRAYVYLGKYGPFGASGVTDYTVDIACVGFPVIFFSVPDNFTAGDGGLAGTEPWVRTGVYLRKLVYLGSDTWRVTMGGFNASTTTGTVVSLATTLRVFGRLDLNYPSGVSGGGYGMRVWNAAGQIVFDSNARMLRLAGNSYDTEIQLQKHYPGYSTGEIADDYSSYDTAATLPFSMAGKSIQATSRGLIRHYQFVGSYYDPGAGLTFYQYLIYEWATGYWSNGSTLHARKLYVGSSSAEFDSPVTVVTSGLADVYTRIAVIDNSQFP